MVDAQAATPTIDASVALNFADRSFQAWNAHDIDAILNMLHGDVIFEAPTWPMTMHGHGAVREYLAATFAAIPDFHAERVGEPLLATHEPRIAWYWRVTATHRGRLEPVGLEATNVRIDFHGGQFVTIRNGKADRVSIIFDTAGMMRQLGVLPATGSRGERLVMALSNLRGRLRRRRS